jgi:hypothetical protein
VYKYGASAHINVNHLIVVAPSDLLKTQRERFPKCMIKIKEDVSSEQTTIFGSFVKCV